MIALSKLICRLISIMIMNTLVFLNLQPQKVIFLPYVYVLYSCSCTPGKCLLLFKYGFSILQNYYFLVIFARKNPPPNRSLLTEG